MMKIGDTGESFLQLWASKTNMTCNPSVRDRYGWDFFLEMDAADCEDTPYDRRMGKLSFLVQVKTTQKRSRKRQIKLTNWEYLSKEPIPTFIILLQLDEEGDLESAYLSHIDQERIERALRKLRESSGRQLNRIRMTFEARPEEKLTEPYHTSMKCRLIECLHGNYREYCVTKIRLLGSLGYSDPLGQISFNVVAKIEDLIDFSIGMQENLPVEKVTIKNDIRFGIPGSIKKLDMATLKATPPAYDVKVILSNDCGVSSETEAKIFLPFWMMNAVPNDKFKFKLESDFCKGVVLPNGKVKMSFNLRFDQQDATIDCLLPVANAVLILSNTECPSKLSIYKDGQLILSAYMDNFHDDKLALPEILISLALMINDLHKVCKHFDLPTNDIIYVDDLYRYRDAVREIRAFIDFRFHGQLNIRFKLLSEIDEKLQVAVPRVISLKIYDKVLVIEGAYVGAPRLLVKDQYCEYMSVVSMNIWKSFLSEVEQLPDLSEDFRELISAYEKDYNVVDFSQSENTT